MSEQVSRFTFAEWRASEIMTGPNIDMVQKGVSMAPETPLARYLHHCLLPQMHALKGLSDQIRALNFKIFTWEDKSLLIGGCGQSAYAY